MWLLGRVPQTTDKVDWEGWRLEIVDMDGRRIDKVLATPLPGPDAAEAGTGSGTQDQP
jgi:putative hemolysin